MCSFFRSLRGCCVFFCCRPKYIVVWYNIKSHVKQIVQICYTSDYVKILVGNRKAVCVWSILWFLYFFSGQTCFLYVDEIIKLFRCYIKSTAKNLPYKMNAHRVIIDCGRSIFVQYDVIIGQCTGLTHIGALKNWQRE